MPPRSSWTTSSTARRTSSATSSAVSATRWTVTTTGTTGTGTGDWRRPREWHPPRECPHDRPGERPRERPPDRGQEPGRGSTPEERRSGACGRRSPPSNRCWRRAGPRLADGFQEIDTAGPLGTASLAQVYRGVLPDGLPVAVRIQRPGVRDVMADDMAALVPQVATASLEELGFGVTLTTVLQHSTRRGIRTSPMVANLGKSFANIEGSIRHLCPELSLVDVFSEELAGIVMDEHSAPGDRAGLHLGSRETALALAALAAPRRRGKNR
ncbi:AarF/UbiB family protein [Streptomyces sp. TRM 70351]|uniref:AarF/UbiB family protein n=1 Tax=Streptomyces sp. TRM 70351 TaxID=3116552 RepID=UPI002E7B4BF5|nr:AarF/UbiB family protein [Streptomyces sp. TRM 70351]MEE1927799.1 AarF/UbiB family protein [Streptomyces sp. TRM 70351]